MRGLGFKVALLILSSCLALGALEVGLRVVGFHYSLAPERVEFGWPDPVTLEEMYEHDPDLFWVPKGYHAELSRLAGEPLDIAFLGDSCTQFGSYAKQVLRLYQERHPEKLLRGAKLGVGGWTSYQGMRQLERDVVPLAPKIVTLYFGWNDHWEGFGVADREIVALQRSPLSALGLTRVGELILRARLGSRILLGGGRPPRVAPEDFAHNLARMVALAREAGATPVLLTAPTSHQLGDEPPQIQQRWLSDLSRLVPLHEQYVEIVRRVARQEPGAQLCDLAARFRALPPDQVQTQLFKADGIHLQPAGDATLARMLFNCLVKEKSLDGSSL